MSKLGTGSIVAISLSGVALVGVTIALILKGNKAAAAPTKTNGGGTQSGGSTPPSGSTPPFWQQGASAAAQGVGQGIGNLIGSWLNSGSSHSSYGGTVDVYQPSTNFDDIKNSTINPNINWNNNPSMADILAGNQNSNNNNNGGYVDAGNGFYDEWGDFYSYND